MDARLAGAAINGLERLCAWADLLDNINVFPVADGDTGRNLVLTLSFFRRQDLSDKTIREDLLMAGRGNSGNIAAGFLSGFLSAPSPDQWANHAAAGCQMARQAIQDPRPGTMLTIFETLAGDLQKISPFESVDSISQIIAHLQQSVLETAQTLPELKEAGLVDAGALGMFLFFEGFFRGLYHQKSGFINVFDIFKNFLTLSPSYKNRPVRGYCIDAMIRTDRKKSDPAKGLDSIGDSALTYQSDRMMKIHIHTDNIEKARNSLNEIGHVVSWTHDDMARQNDQFESRGKNGSVHIITDAAGSVTRDDARQFGMTLLNSYINHEYTSIPETYVHPEKLYEWMRRGTPVSTSQASVFERYQHYRSILEKNEYAIYLCTGSAFTGNFETATAWQSENDPTGRLNVIDTGAASGRLGLISLATAAFARKTSDMHDILNFADAVIKNAKEFVFLDTLRFLAAGGRLSKTSAFLGDMFRVKPVISPTSRGAVKVATTKNHDEQIRLALQKVSEIADRDTRPFLMLEYSDNENWLRDVPGKEIRKHYPHAKIIERPLSLTSGVHMGPGTWALAMLPEKYSHDLMMIEFDQDHSQKRTPQ